MGYTIKFFDEDGELPTIVVSTGHPSIEHAFDSVTQFGARRWWWDGYCIAGADTVYWHVPGQFGIFRDGQ